MTKTQADQLLAKVQTIRPQAKWNVQYSQYGSSVQFWTGDEYSQNWIWIRHSIERDEWAAQVSNLVQSHWQPTLTDAMVEAYSQKPYSNSHPANNR